MKMEATTRSTSNKILLAKKICSIIRIMLKMVKKGISKGNLIMGINLFLKKSNQMAHKAINGLILHHNSLICKPNNPSNHFFSYEFSCNNSPALGPYLIHMAHQHRPKPKPEPSSRSKYHFEDPAIVTVVHRVLEMINSSEGPLLGRPQEWEWE